MAVNTSYQISALPSGPIEVSTTSVMEVELDYKHKKPPGRCVINIEGSNDQSRWHLVKQIVSETNHKGRVFFTPDVSYIRLVPLSVYGSGTVYLRQDVALEQYDVDTSSQTAINDLTSRVAAIETAIANTQQNLPGQLQFSVATATVIEGSSITLYINRVNGTTGAVTCNFNISTALTLTTQYTTSVASGGTVSFAQGETQKTIVITSVADSISSDGTITCTLDTFTSGGGADAAIEGIRSTLVLTVQNSAGAGTTAISGNEVFFDDFNYAIARNSALYNRYNNPFVTSGGWSDCKSVQFGEAGAHAYLYTTTTIEGYAGIMPGVSGTGRVLCFEQLSGTDQEQTDCYLVHGQEYTEGVSNPALLETIPADCWIQFWIYPQNSGSQTGHTKFGKLLYPSRAYGTVGLADADGAGWLCDINAVKRLPLTIDAENTSSNSFYLESRCQYGGFDQTTGLIDPNLLQWRWDQYLGNDDSLLDVFGQTVDSAIAENTWSLIRIHYDISNVGTNTYQIYKRELGTPTFTLISEWVDGGTVSSQNVRIQPNQHVDGSYGHAFLKFLSTFGYYSGSPNVTSNTDSFIYFSDFAISAGTNSGGNGTTDLPTYTEY